MVSDLWRNVPLSRTFLGLERKRILKRKKSYFWKDNKIPVDLDFQPRKWKDVKDQVLSKSEKYQKSKYFENL